MTITQLNYIITLEKTRNFTKAANLCKVSQPEPWPRRLCPAQRWADPPKTTESYCCACRVGLGRRVRYRFQW